MQQLIYSSRSTRPLASAELAALLLAAQRANAAREVTGVLLCSGDLFVQVLEGEAQVLQRLWAKLLHDPRHTDLLPLADKPVARRSFLGWSMAFEGQPAAAYAGLPGELPAGELASRLASLGLADALLMRSLRQQLGAPAA